MDAGFRHGVVLKGCENGTGASTRCILGSPAERVERPSVRILFVTEDVRVAVIGADLEAAKPFTVPLIEHFLDFVSGGACLLREAETKRAFVGAVSGVALDVEDHWRSPQSEVRGPKSSERMLPALAIAGSYVLCCAFWLLTSDLGLRTPDCFHHAPTGTAASRRNFADSSGGVGLM